MSMKHHEIVGAQRQSNAWWRGGVTRAAEKELPRVIVEGTRDKKCLEEHENLKAINGLTLGWGIWSQEGIGQTGQDLKIKVIGDEEDEERAHTVYTLWGQPSAVSLGVQRSPLHSGPFPLSRPRNERKGQEVKRAETKPGADPPPELMKWVKWNPLSCILSGWELITWVLKYEGTPMLGRPNPITIWSLNAGS